jgi:methionine aminopeptidase
MDSSVRPIKSLLLSGLKVSIAEVKSLVVQIEHNLQVKCTSALRLGTFVVQQISN